MDAELHTLSEQVNEVRAAITRRKKLRTHLKHINNEIQKHQREYSYLERALRKEEKDVNKLERLSVRSMFERFLGNIRDQLDIERQEYLTVSLKYNECIDLLRILEYERMVIQEKIDELPTLQKKYETLLRKKLEKLKSVSPPVRSQLKSIDVNEQSLNIKRIEIDEAIQAGQAALRQVTALLTQMKQVKGWGRYELQGQGKYSTYAKKSFIDKARKKAMQVKVALDKFEIEIRDVFKQFDIKDKFDIGRFEKFLSTFYDNLITDWIVQRNATNAINSIKTIADKVQRILGTLEAEKMKIQHELKSLERIKKTIVLSW